jgi:hypothetical protein
VVPGSRAWRGFVPAKLDNQIVWKCPPIDAWDNREPYYSMFDPMRPYSAV